VGKLFCVLSGRIVPWGAGSAGVDPAQQTSDLSARRLTVERRPVSCTLEENHCASNSVLNHNEWDLSRVQSALYTEKGPVINSERRHESA
jgi:hypothetical protein